MSLQWISYYFHFYTEAKIFSNNVTVKWIVLNFKHVIISGDDTDLKVVKVIIQQYCSIGDALLGPDKYKWHHSL